MYIHSFMYSQTYRNLLKIDMRLTEISNSKVGRFIYPKGVNIQNEWTNTDYDIFYASCNQEKVARTYLGHVKLIKIKIVYHLETNNKNNTHNFEKKITHSN